MDLETLFKTVWKMNYKPVVHSGVVRNALTRTRGQTGVKIVTEDSRVRVVDSLVLDF